jgi:hypothetical protein
LTLAGLLQRADALLGILFTILFTILFSASR